MFFDDAYGKKCPHNENWKHVAFSTDKEASEKLKLIEAERKREDEAEPFSDEDARKFLKALSGSLQLHMQKQLLISRSDMAQYSPGCRHSYI